MFTVLSIAGPKSKDLMEEMSGSEMSMHPFTYRQTNITYRLLTYFSFKHYKGIEFLSLTLIFLISISLQPKVMDL